MRAAVFGAVAVLAIAMSPVAAAEPGVWPDCDPNRPEVMAECSTPPSDGSCVQPAVDDYSGLNGGAFVCAASGLWAWRSMTYPEWQQCQQVVLQGNPC